jgi:hypothetical protein
MNTTRRNFIRASAFAAFFAGTGLFSSLASASENSVAPGELPNDALGNRLFYLTSEDFKKYIGAQFSLTRENDVTTAQLMGVTQTIRPNKIAQNLSGGSRRKLMRETFTLSFQSLNGDFSQATYQIWHPNLGQFDLFLVPGSKQGEQISINAVINRI